MDVRSVLSTIAVPTLVLHRSNFAIVPIKHGRYLADHIAGARLVEVAGGDAWFFTEGAEQVLDEVAEFLTGVRPPAAPDRMLATVLFSDIVGSHRTGGAAWGSQLAGAAGRSLRDPAGGAGSVRRPRGRHYR
jgi:hypothetical protein